MSAPIVWAPAVVGATGTADRVDQFLVSHSQILLHQGTTTLSGTLAGTTTLNTNTGSAAQWIDQPFFTTTTQTSIPRIDLALAGPASPTTTVAAGSNGNILPQAVINVASTTGFPNSGVVAVASTSAVPQLVSYNQTPTPALVQQASITGVSVGAAGTFTATFPRATQAGNLLVAYAVDFTEAHVPTVPGGWSTAFSQADATNNEAQILAYLPAAAVTTSVTFTSTGTGTDLFHLIIAEFSGIAASTPLDQQTSNTNQGPASTMTVTSGTTTQNVELVLGGFCDENTAFTTFLAGPANQPVATTQASILVWSTTTTTGAQTVTATNALNGVARSELWMGGIATFKAAIGTATTLTGCSGGTGTLSTSNAVNITASDTTVTLQTDAGGYVSSTNTMFASSGNLLTVGQASLENGVLNGWNTDTNVTVSVTTAQALDGTHSLQMSSNAAGAMKSEPAAGTGAIPVTAGNTYSASAWFRSQVSVRSCQVAILWYNQDGTFNNFVLGTGVNDSTSAWTQATVASAVAPAGAYFAIPQAVVNATAAAAEIHYVDEILFNAGANTTWAAPSGSVTDTSANWVINQWAGKIVWAPNVSNFTPPYATVASNTAQTLTLTGSWQPVAPSGGTIFTIDGTPSGTVISSTVVPADFIPTGITTIAAGSNNAVLPQATINVASTSGFLPVGQLLVTTSIGPQLVNYTGTTSTTFTGCAFGAGAMATGGAVVAATQLSIPLNATVYPSTNYHIVIAGTTSTTNFCRFLTGLPRNANASTGTSAAGPWTVASTSLVFATFGGNQGVLRNSYEDSGAKWTSYDYGLSTSIGSSLPPSMVKEYAGSQRTVSLLQYTNGLLTSATTSNTLSPTTWGGATTGNQINAKDVNQLFGTHTTQYIYDGTTLVSNGITSTLAAGSSVIHEYGSATPTSLVGSNTGAAAQWLDQPFTTPAGVTSMSRILLVPCVSTASGTGADVTIELRNDSAGNPANTALASVVLPADFMNKSVYTSSNGTVYGAATVADSGGNFPYYGGPNISGNGLEFFFGMLLVAGNNFGMVSGTQPAAATGTVNVTTWTPAQPANGTVYKTYPIVSIPLPVTGLLASTKYHIVIDGTTSTTNFAQFATTANVANEVLQTGTSTTGPWTTTTTKTLIFGVWSANSYASNSATATSLRHTWEDGGARWTGIDYVLTNGATYNGTILFFREYTGNFRNYMTAAYSGNPGGNLGIGSLVTVQ